MSGVLRWEKPPTSGPLDARRFDSHAVAADLKSRPGEWAVVAENPGNAGLSTRIKDARQMAAFAPAGSFQACHRTVNGVKTIYARYVGGAA